MDKTLYKLAEKIEMSITHPQQILRQKDDEFNLLVLREGEVGFTVKKNSCSFNGKIVDTIKVNKNDKPFILGL